MLVSVGPYILCVMELVEDAVLFPGACLLSGAGGGPFVDTGRHYGPQDERIYVQELIAIEIGEAAGMVSGEQHRAALARLTELEQILNEAEQKLKDAQLLHEAVRETFAQGAVRIGGDRFKLRPRRGRPAPKLNEELSGGR